LRLLRETWRRSEIDGTKCVVRASRRVSAPVLERSAETIIAVSSD